MNDLHAGQCMDLACFRRDEGRKVSLDGLPYQPASWSESDGHNRYVSRVELYGCVTKDQWLSAIAFSSSDARALRKT
jgi:hypothetical protein